MCYIFEFLFKNSIVGSCRHFPKANPSLTIFLGKKLEKILFLNHETDDQREY